MTLKDVLIFCRDVIDKVLALAKHPAETRETFCYAKYAAKRVTHKPLMADLGNPQIPGAHQ